MPGSIQMPRIGYEQEQLVSQDLSHVFSIVGATGLLMEHGRIAKSSNPELRIQKLARETSQHTVGHGVGAQRKH